MTSSKDRITAAIFTFFSLFCLIVISPLSAQQIPATACECETTTPVRTAAVLPMFQTAMQPTPMLQTTVPIQAQPITQFVPSTTPTLVPTSSMTTTVQPIQVARPMQAIASQPLMAQQRVVGSSGGPGTEMTRIINRLGMGSDCSRCKNLAAEMDQRGPEWVRQNMDYVVGRTVSNAENLGYNMGPIRRAGVRRIVRRSVRVSE